MARSFHSLAVRPGERFAGRTEQSAQGDWDRPGSDVRHQTERALRDSEKLAATGRMAATIAHEINNPLEAVVNLVYLAKTDPQYFASDARFSF